MSNQRQVGTGITAFEGDYDGYLPPYENHSWAGHLYRLDKSHSSPFWTWNQRLAEGGYMGDEGLWDNNKYGFSKIFFCPTFHWTEHESYQFGNLHWYWFWNEISYGMSNGLFYDYAGVVGSKAYASRRVNIYQSPSQTIMTTDSGKNGGLISQIPSAWILASHSSSSPGPAPRHDNGSSCNVLWVDGHVSTTKSPSNNPGSLYNKNALTDHYDNPSYWDFK